MSELCCGESARWNAGATRVADMLALAASPTFAVMGVVSVLGSSPTEMLCTATHSPLGGMATMYFLMSALHVGPWLRLLRA